MNLDHVFLELALSDENVALAEVIAVAGVRCDRKGRVLSAFAQEFPIHGLVEKKNERRGKVKDATRDAMEGFKGSLLTPYVDEYVVVSRNARVYHSILSDMHCRFATGKPWLDISQLAWPLGYSDMIPDRNFDTLCKHFGVTLDPSSSASGNCEALVRVYWAMMTRYRTALIGEEAVRDFGGETLKSVRKFIGI